MWSKEPYMKALMMEVLPVPWSPRNTALYLDRGATWGRREEEEEEEEGAVEAVEAEPAAPAPAPALLAEADMRLGERCWGMG